MPSQRPARNRRSILAQPRGLHATAEADDDLKPVRTLVPASQEVKRFTGDDDEDAPWATSFLSHAPGAAAHGAAGIAGAGAGFEHHGAAARHIDHVVSAVDIDHEGNVILPSTPRSGTGDLGSNGDSSLKTSGAGTTRDQKGTGSEQHISREDDDAQIDTFIGSEEVQGVEDPETIKLKKNLALCKKKLAVYEKKLEDMQKTMKEATIKAATLAAALEEEQKTRQETEEAFEKQISELLTEHQGQHGNRKFGVMVALGGGAGGVGSRAREEMLKRQKEDAKKILTDAANVEDDDAGLGTGDGRKKRFWERFEAMLVRFTPLQAQVRKIEARFGSSVAAYFQFFQWLVIKHLFLAIISIISLMYHIWHLQQSEGYTAWFSFVGTLPALMLYDHYAPTESVHYTVVNIILSGVILVRASVKWMGEDKQIKILETEDSSGVKRKFSKLVLNSWDFSVAKEEDAGDLKRIIADSLKLLIHEEEVEARASKRTNMQKLIVYTRRGCGMLLYIILQAGLWTVILLITAYAIEIRQKVASMEAIGSLSGTVAASVAPAVVSIINGVLPSLIKKITAFEQWDSSATLNKLMVIRLFFAQLFAVLVQIFSYLLLINPVIFTSSAKLLGLLPWKNVRASAELQASVEYACRGQQAAIGIASMSITQFIVSKASSFAGPIIQLVVRKLKKQQGFEKTPYDIATSMVSLLYVQALIMFALPLCPTFGILSFAMQYTTFWFDYVYTLKLMSRPFNPWSSKDASGFVIKMYFIVVTTYVGLTGLLLQYTSLPKSCELQDSYTSLCQYKTYDQNNMICALDPTHDSYTYFNDKSTCAEGYPKCICNGKLSCGPYVMLGYPTESFQKTMESANYIGSFYSLATSKIVVPWILIVVLFLNRTFRGNTIDVVQTLAVQKEAMMQAEIHILKRKVEKYDERKRKASLLG